MIFDVTNILDGIYKEQLSVIEIGLPGKDRKCAGVDDLVWKKTHRSMKFTVIR